MRLAFPILAAAAVLCSCATADEEGPLGLPDQLTFTVVEGGPDPAPIQLTVTNPGTGPRDLGASADTVTGLRWRRAPGGITGAPGGSGQLPVAIQAGALGLAPGTHTGTLVIDGTCGASGALAGGSPAEVSVNVTVIPAGVAWPVSGTVTGLQGTGLELTEANSGDYTVLNAAGPFAFAVSDNTPFNIAVTAQPTAPAQVCSVTGGNGFVSGGPVTGVQVTCVTNCPADILEPNDSTFQTAPLPTTLTALEGCPGDDDWFLVELASWVSLDLQLAFAHAEGNLDVVITDAGSTVPVTSVASTTDNESLSWVAPYGPADFGVQVSMTGSDTGSLPGSPYSIVGTVTCDPDADEPNDVQAAAASITGGTSARTHCGDDDWYSVDAAPWEEVQVQTFFGNTEGNIDLFVVDSGGNVLQSSQTNTDAELLTYTANNEQVLQLTMADAGTVPGNSYDLSILVSCPPDLAEPNDFAGTPAQLTLPVTGAEYWLCGSDADWFEFYLGAGEIINVTVVTPLGLAEGDVALELQDDNGVQLAATNTSSATETLSYTSAGGGLHRLGVTLPSDAGPWAGQGYTLTASTTQGCTDDSYEPNDSAGAAPLLSPAFYPMLELCPSSTDWFSFAMNGGDYMTVQLNFTNSEGNIDLYVFDPNGVSVGTDTDANSDWASVGFSAPMTGTYTLNVVLAADAGFQPGNTYGLDLITGS